MVHLHVHNGSLYTVENACSVHAYNELTCIVFFILPRVFKHIAKLTDKMNEVFKIARPLIICLFYYIKLMIINKALLLIF